MMVYLQRTDDTPPPQNNSTERAGMFIPYIIIHIISHLHMADVKKIMKYLIFAA